MSVPSQRLGDRIERFFFVAGMAVLVFLAGMAADRYDLFPAPLVNAAVDAARDWRDNWRHYFGIRSKWLEPNRRGAGVTVYDETRAQPGLTFVTAYRDGQFGAYLIDMKGEIRHRWTVDLAEVWRAAGYDDPPMPDVDFSIHGADLAPNGDVLLNLAGAGVARLDRCSRIVWATSFKAHHDISYLPDGRIVVPGDLYLDTPYPELPYVRPGREGILKDDTLVLLDSDGRLLEEISLLKVLAKSGRHDLLTATPRAGWTIATRDPLHVNNIEVLTEELAPAFPDFAAGDFLVSMRNINTVVVLDGRTFEVKWSQTGPFFGQHDPDFLPNGNIVLFDNRLKGDRPQYGYSRILEIDPRTREIVWSYEGSDTDPFYTKIGGKVQRLDNGNLLVVSPQEGRVFELTREQPPRKVWEFVNAVGEKDVGYVFDALRFAEEALTFLDAPCPGREPGA